METPRLPDPDLPRFNNPPAIRPPMTIKPNPKAVLCPRCNVAKRYLGTKAFHEGSRWGALGDLAELFVNKVSFDVYACMRCGSVELFIDGLGENLRPH